MANPKITDSKERPMKIDRKSILRLEEVQSRMVIDHDTVETYVDDFRNGAKFPPVRIVRTSDGYVCWDGWHRMEMYYLVKVDKVECLVRDGTMDDAIMLSAGANCDHGRPRTWHDKERSIIMLLNRQDGAGKFIWKAASTKWLADTANVSQHFADKVRNEFSGKPKRVAGQDGKFQSATKSRPTNQVPAREPVSHPYDTSPDTLLALGDATPKKRLPEGVVEDNHDRPVPARIAPIFVHRRELNRLAIITARLKTEWLAALRHESKAGRSIALAAVEKALDDAVRTVRSGMPDALCPECAGVEASEDAEPCKLCEGWGWLPEARVANLPNRLRKIVEHHQRQGA